MHSGLKSTVRRTSRRMRLGTILSAPVGGRLYGDTDKVSHGYLSYYQRHFRHRRYRDLLVIEIGVGGVGGYESSEAGGSLRLWRDYFARSTILGSTFSGRFSTSAIACASSRPTSPGAAI